MSRFDRSFDYIAYRLSQNVVEFNRNVKPELERMLPGTRDLNSNYLLDADRQRQVFLMKAVQFADYFRPMSAAATKNIPIELTPKSRPFATDDIRQQIRLRKQIEEGARMLASLLRQHNDVTQRLGVRKLDCDPLELMLHARGADNKTSYIDGVEDEFNLLLMRRGFEGQPARAMSSLLDSLNGVAAEADRSLIPAEVRLGISSRKRDWHFLEAFENWLAENQEEGGGFVPNGFHLSEPCWAAILSCITYKEVSSRSVQTYRSRAPEYIENALSNAPRFDVDEMLESWGQESN